MTCCRCWCLTAAAAKAAAARRRSLPCQLASSRASWPSGPLLLEARTQVRGDAACRCDARLCDATAPLERALCLTRCATVGPFADLPAAPQPKRPAGAPAKGAQPVKRKRPAQPPVRRRVACAADAARDVDTTPFLAPQPPAPAEADADPLSLCHLDMRGAAVADHELPPLLNGEVRVLGQTLTRAAALARSRAVAEWRRQGRDKQQWAEILSPMADADKAAVLRSLHRFLGLSNGQELVSALPPDPPCSSLVESFIIPKDDPRVALRGQYGVRVKRGGAPLQPLVVVGTYRAFTPTLDEYNLTYKFGGDERVRKKLTHTLERRGPDAPDLSSEELIVELDVSELLFDSFTAEYELWNQRPGVGDNPQPQPPSGDGYAEAPSPAAAMPQLMASAYGFGNMMCLINDGLGPRPKGAPHLSDEQSEQACNAKLIEVLVHGWPAILVVTVKQIKPGEELLLLYGDGYWEQLRQLAFRLNGHRANLPAAPRLLSDGGAAAASAASGGEGGGSAAAPGGGSHQPTAPRAAFAPRPSILAGPGRSAAPAAAAAAAHAVHFADALPSYAGGAFDRSAAKRHASAEGAAAFEPATFAANFEAMAESRGVISAAEAADAAKAARALSEGLAAGAAEAPAEGDAQLSIAEALDRARAAAEERGRELARELAAAD